MKQVIVLLWTMQRFSSDNHEYKCFGYQKRQQRHPNDDDNNIQHHQKQQKHKQLTYQRPERPSHNHSYGKHKMKPQQCGH